jgi:hypothetical protein
MKVLEVFDQHSFKKIEVSDKENRFGDEINSAEFPLTFQLMVESGENLGRVKLPSVTYESITMDESGSQLINLFLVTLNISIRNTRLNKGDTKIRPETELSFEVKVNQKYGKPDKKGEIDEIHAHISHSDLLISQTFKYSQLFTIFLRLLHLSLLTQK